MIQQINFHKLKHQSPYFIVNGVRLTSLNLYQLLFLKELETKGVKYNTTNVKILQLTRCGLVEDRSSDEGIFCHITRKGKDIIKEISE